MTLNKKALTAYVAKQLNIFFPDERPVEVTSLIKNMDEVISKIQHCFSFVNNRYFFDGRHILFNHLNADQYAMFLYILSNTIYKADYDINLCDKIFYLNKMLHGIDVFYEVELPDIFLFVHPLGTVLGRGNYSNFFMVYQRCGVGSNKDVYPKLGEYTTLHPGASVLGASKVGRNCKIAADSLLLDQSLKDNTLYIGKPDKQTLKTLTQKPSIWRN